MQFPYSFFAGVGGASIAGFILGGEAGPSSDKSDKIQKMTKSSETFANISATISSARIQAAGFCSQVAGYCCGGIEDGPNRTFATSKISFSTETVSASTSLITGTSGQYGVASAVYGYIIGSVQPTGGLPRYTGIQRIALSNDAHSVSSSVSLYGGITLGRIFAFNNSSQAYAYLSSSVGSSSLQKMLFSTEAIASSSSFAASLEQTAAPLNGDLFGYIFQNQASIPDAFKTSYSTDTRSVFLATGTLTVQPQNQPGLNFYDAGYLVRADAGGGAVNDALKLALSTETVSYISGVQAETCEQGCGNVQY